MLRLWTKAVGASLESHAWGQSGVGTYSAASACLGCSRSCSSHSPPGPGSQSTGRPAHATQTNENHQNQAIYYCLLRSKVYGGRQDECAYHVSKVCLAGIQVDRCTQIQLRACRRLELVFTSMRASEVTTVLFSMRCHSVHTLPLASCALLELAMSRAARPALSRFSDVVLAACSKQQTLQTSPVCSHEHQLQGNYR